MEEPIIAKSPDWIGQPIAIILASSRQRALELSHNCQIIMKHTAPPICSIEEGIEKESFFAPIKTHIETENFESAIENDKSLIKIESELKINSQFHGYTEPLCAVCDYDNGNYHISVTTQFPASAY